METIGGDGSKTELVMKKKGKLKSTTTGKRRRATTTLTKQYTFLMERSRQRQNG